MTAISGADAPGFTARGRAGIGRAVLVDEGNLRAGLLEVERGPGTEGTGTDDGDIGGLAGAHPGGGGRSWAGAGGWRVRTGRLGSGSREDGARSRRGRLHEAAPVYRAPLPSDPRRRRIRKGLPTPSAVHPAQRDDSGGAMRTSRMGESAPSSAAPPSCPFMLRMYETTSR